MKILITGSNGFLGKNLISRLHSDHYEVLSFDRENTLQDLIEYTAQCDFVVHLAGINRPTNAQEFYDGNRGFTETLVELLQKNNNNAPIIVSSSIQAELNNDYGISKLEGENVLRDHANKVNAPLYIYRFSNLFGKWSQPNYNTVIATWCYNVARNLPITVNDPSIELNLMYIDDVCRELIACIEGNPTRLKHDLCTVNPSYNVSLGEVSTLIHKFKASRKTLFIPNMQPGFETKLYSTYLSFIPEEDFGYDLKMNVDERGSFTEFLKSDERGQVSINVSKPGVTKGQHWHHSKNEKFLVVSGQGKIQFRNIFSDEIIEYAVSAEKLRVVDIPTGYTHNIINTGESDMVTVMWANEPFDPNNPDTYYEEV